MVFLFGGQSLLAVGWEVRWDWWLEHHASHLHVGVGCSHTAAGLRERAKDKHYKKPGGKLQDFLWPGLEVSGNHFRCIVFINQPRSKGRGIMFQLLMYRATCAAGRVVIGGSLFSVPPNLHSSPTIYVTYTHFSPKIPKVLSLYDIELQISNLWSKSGLVWMRLLVCGSWSTSLLCLRTRKLKRQVFGPSCTQYTMEEQL